MKSLHAKVVCLCGSFRFASEITAVASALRQLGIEPLAPTPDPDVAQGVQGCFRRIDAADAVLVVNPGGYIGTSVLLDMGYAHAKGKPIYALASHPDPAVMSLVAAVVSLELAGAGEPAAPR